MGDHPYPASTHDGPRPAEGEIARALDRAEHRRLEQRILGDAVLEQATKRRTAPASAVEILSDVPSSPPPAIPLDPRRRRLWMVLAAVSVLAPVALVLGLSRRAAELPSVPPTSSPIDERTDSGADRPIVSPAPPASVVPEPLDLEPIPTATAGPRAAARPSASAASDEIAPNGDKPFFEKKRTDRTDRSP